MHFKTSPVKLVSDIKIPILLIHATDDVVVPVVQSRIMANELKVLQKAYDRIELEGGNHSSEYLWHRKKYSKL